MGIGIVGYSETVRRVSRDGREVTIRNVIPVFRDEEERRRVRQRTEDNLYDIFVKYTD